MNIDRLSFLPDEVICHILSFLQTKPSVQTSVLSNSWKFLWTSVPSLGFDFDDSRRVDVITKIVLQQHKHDIHTFCISIIDHDDEIKEEFQSWIVNITTRNIRKLVIVVQVSSIQLDLPQCLFTCKTLVDLSLNGCGGIPMSGLYFPALKKLKLDYVQFTSHESLAHLISGCPVLEELSIQGRMLGHVGVSSPTLTHPALRFKMINYSSLGVNLDTPALRYLRLDSLMPDEFSAGALDFLIEADIALMAHNDNSVYSRKVLPFFGKLCNVKLLRLIIYGKTVINDSSLSALAIKFHNLTKLDLGADLGFIIFFLENVNNLQDLKLMILNSKVDGDNQYNWMKPKRVPACMISHLQTVKVRGLGWCFEDGFELVRYILVNGKVLKRMKVPTPETHKHVWEKKLETLKRVALFERGSRECELSVGNYYIF